MEPLSKKQQLIYEAIARSIQERGYAPTIRELGSQFGLTSTNAVSELLERIERKGWIQRCPGAARTITLTTTTPIDLSDLTPPERDKVVNFVAGLRAARAA